VGSEIKNTITNIKTVAIILKIFFFIIFYF